MTLAFFVEGRSEKVTLPILVRKASPEHERLLFRQVPRGDMFAARKMEAYIRALLAHHRDVRKILVCVDAECTPYAELKPRTEAIERELHAKGFPVRYILVVHSLEGWLASDSEAMAKFLGKAGIPKGYPRDWDAVCRPAELLARLIARSGKSFHKIRDGPRLAELVSIQRLVATSPSFARFVESLRDP